MFRKKNHIWYWHTFWLLVFCIFLFTVARFFMKAVNRDESKKDKERKKKKQSFESEPLFI